LDFYLILFFLASGILLGFKIDNESIFLKISGSITKLGLIILLTAMGANLGSNEEIFRQLGRIGLNAFVFALMSIIFSVLFIVLFTNSLKLNSFLLTGSEEQAQPEEVEGNMSLIIFLSVIFGILIGYFLLQPEYYSWIDPLTNYSLAVLLFGVGIDIGASREILADLKLMGWKILALPILIALGSLFGAVISGFILGFEASEAAAVGAGFGWYSLSGVLISKLHSAELGSLAFLANVFRELMTVILLPFVVKYFGSLAAVAPGGATTMDVTLPLVKESGEEAVRKERDADIENKKHCVQDFLVPYRNKC